MLRGSNNNKLLQQCNGRDSPHRGRTWTAQQYSTGLFIYLFTYYANNLSRQTRDMNSNTNSKKKLEVAPLCTPCGFLGPRVCPQNGISTDSAVSAGFTRMTDTETRRPRHRQVKTQELPASSTDCLQCWRCGLKTGRSGCDQASKGSSCNAEDEES